MVTIQKTILSVGEDTEKEKSSCSIGGLYIGAATVENNMEIPQKIKNRNTI